MKVLIRGHEDADGIISAFLVKKLVVNEYREANPQIDIRLGKALRAEEIEKISKKDYDVIIFVDTGSERGKAINKYLRDKTVWIMDHHRRFDREYPEVDVYINPVEEGRDSLDYAVSAVLVAEELRKRRLLTRFNMFLAAAAAAGDIADFDGRGKFQGLNWKMIKEASKGKDMAFDYELVLRYKDVDSLNRVIYSNYYPVPDESMLKLNWDELGKNWYKMTIEEKTRTLDAIRDVYGDDFAWAYRKTLINKRYPREIAEIHEFAAFIDSVKDIRAITSPMEFMEKAREVRKKKVIKDYSIPRPMDIGPVYLLLSERFINNISITMAATRHYTDKPVVAITEYKGKWYITARQHPNVGVDLGRMLYEVTKGLGYGGGHKFAAGGGIYKKEDVPEVVQRIRSYEF